MEPEPEPESTSTVSLWDDDGERASYHSLISQLPLLTLPENMDQANLTDAEEDDDSNLLSMSKVFENDVILRSVFANCDFQTLKACRNVCSLWKSLIDPSFKKRATVFYGGTGGDSEDVDMNMLLSYVDQDPPFTSLALFGDWKAETLTRFFLNEGQILTGLYLKKVRVTENGDGNILNIYVLPKLPKLKRLKISVGDKYSWRHSTPISVRWNFFHSLDRLYLKGCVLNLEKGCRISPKELTLIEYHSLFLNGRRFELTGNRVVFLHELVDFSSLKTLRMFRIGFIVDLQVPTSLQTVKFGKVTRVINWEQSTWKIDFMQLEDAVFGRNQMSLKKLEILFGTINLAYLPGTLESLLLGECAIICNQPVQCPLLKLLVLDERRNLNCLAYFRNFKNLSELIIVTYNRYYGVTTKLNLEHIPINLKQLTLRGYIELTSGTGAPSRRLQTITMCHMFRNEFNKWDFSKLNAENLIYSKVGTYSLAKDIFIEKIVTISQKFCQSVTVGEFSFEQESDWKDSVVRKYVDKQSDFYTFSNGRGVAIDSSAIRERLSQILTTPNSIINT